jgi:hypothetical protein
VGREGLGGDAMDHGACLELGGAKDLGLGLAHQQAGECQEIVARVVLNPLEQPLGFRFLLDRQVGKAHGILGAGE